MLKFIKALLQKKSAKATPPILAVELMSFPDILAYIQQLGDFISVQQGSALTKRLYEIAYYDHHIEDEYRTGARALLDPLKSTIESVSTPEAIELYRSANANMEDNVPRLGVGSLAWLIVEHEISEDQLIPFIARPEHSHLLENFFATLSPATAEVIKLRVQEQQHKGVQDS